MYGTNSATSSTPIADMPDMGITGFALHIACRHPSEHPDSLPFIRAIAEWAEEECLPYDNAIVFGGWGGDACPDPHLEIILRGMEYAPACVLLGIIGGLARAAELPCHIEVNPEVAQA